MFHKDQFKLKFEFFLRCYCEFTNSDVWQVVELNEYKYTCFKILWQTRFEQTIIQGIDNREIYEVFCQLLNISMEQLDAKVLLATITSPSQDAFYIQLNMLLIETVNELSTEIEEALKELLK